MSQFPSDLFANEARALQGAVNQNFRVAVICREAFMRDAIEEALRRAGATRLHLGSNLQHFADEQLCFDVILYVEPSIEDTDSRLDIELVQIVAGQNWVVMCHDRESELFNRLANMGAIVSAIPFDVSREDIVLVTQLAAGNHRIFLDDFCDVQIFEDMRQIRAANLTADQLRTLKFLSEGYSNKEIAQIEDCAENAVKMRVRGLLSKLGMSNRTRAAVLAARAGLKLDLNTDELSHDLGRKLPSIRNSERSSENYRAPYILAENNERRVPLSA